MDFQRYLKDACTITIRYPLLMILGGLLIQILNLVSLSLLAGPLFAGYLLMVIVYLRDGRPPAFKDLLAGLKRFAALFPYFGVILLIIAGIFLLVVPGLIFATWWLYTLPLMADREMRLDDAMRLSKQRVQQEGFFMHLVFLLMITFIPAMVLNFLSAMLPALNLLKILLPPLQVGCLAGLYLDTFAEQKTEDRGQRTEKIEDGRQKTDDGGRMTEKQCSSDLFFVTYCHLSSVICHLSSVFWTTRSRPPAGRRHRRPLHPSRSGTDPGQRIGGTRH